MPIKPDKCCSEHTKEKEDSGTCSQTEENEKQEKEQNE